MADRRALSILSPGSLLVNVDSETFDALTKRQVFSQIHDIKRDRMGEFKDHLGGSDVIIRRPIRVTTAIYKVLSTELSTVPARVACSDLRASDEVGLKDRVQQLPEGCQ